MMRYPWKKLSAQEKLRETLTGIMLDGEKSGPPPPGESYEWGPEDWQDRKPERVTGDGPLLNSKGEPANFDEKKLALTRETLRNLQFPNPDEMVGPPAPETPRERVLRLQREMVASGHERCGNIVERGVGHTGNFVCLVYLGTGGGWDPPKP